MTGGQRSRIATGIVLSVAFICLTSLGLRQASLQHRQRDDKLQLSAYIAKARSASRAHGAEIPQSVPKATFGIDTEVDPPQPNAPTIFVSISSFRDDFCSDGIRSAFDRARNPDQLFVGINQQWDPDEDVDCVDFSDICPGLHPVCSRQDHIRVIKVHAKDARGPTIARYWADTLLRDEEYHLQMDAHSLFRPNWDAVVVAMWKSIDNEFAVISSYPKTMRDMKDWYPAKKAKLCIICRTSTSATTPKLTMHLSCALGTNPNKDGTPVLTPYWGAGLSFSKAHRVRNVPNDPFAHFLFAGEELTMGLRLFTHGYDTYAPSADILFHLYFGMRKTGSVRRRIWDTDWATQHDIQNAAAERMMAMMGEPFDHVPHLDLRNLTDFGLGKSRTLAQFWKWAGVDWPKRRFKNMCDDIYAGKVKKVPYLIPPTTGDPR